MGGQLAAQNKRKEKARIAARARRSQEASIIMEMANELHITQEKIRRIDKATIVKMAIDYIKAFEILCRLRSNCNNSICNSGENSSTSCSSSSSTIIDTNDLLENQQILEQQQNQDQDQHNHHQLPQQQQQQVTNPLYPTPKLNTLSIFAPRTDDMDSHFLMINKLADGRATFILKPDTEVLDEDDLTHLAPQAGDTSIVFDKLFVE